MKKVKFIPIGFYDYDKEIQKAIENQGYEVDCFTPIGNYTTIQKLINAFTKGKFLENKIRKRQMKYMLGDKTKYDYVFVINGRHLHPDLLKKYREQQKDAKFVLYVWDDIARVEHYEENKEFFDEIYTFDHADSEKYGLKLFHNFYTRHHVYKGEKKKYIFSLSGLLHSGRVNIWDSIIRQCHLNPKRCYLYLLGFKISDFVQAVLPGGNRWMKLKYIKVNSVPLANMAKIMKESRVTLDVQFGSQTGLTLRVFESMASKTKIITANPNVKDYDIYKYGNIYVIDRDNPKVPQKFFKEKFNDIPEEVMKEYYIDNWIENFIPKNEE